MNFYVSQNYFAKLDFILQVGIVKEEQLKVHGF